MTFVLPMSFPDLLFLLPEILLTSWLCLILIVDFSFPRLHNEQLAYLFKMMRGLFYGPMDQKYSHAHDAVAVVDRLPLLIMITVSIGFFFFPMHLYNVVRSGVDPLIAKIIRVVPVAGLDRETVEVTRETTNLLGTPGALLLTNTSSPLAPTSSRGLE